MSGLQDGYLPLGRGAARPAPEPLISAALELPCLPMAVAELYTKVGGRIRPKGGRAGGQRPGASADCTWRPGQTCAPGVLASGRGCGGTAGPGSVAPSRAPAPDRGEGPLFPTPPPAASPLGLGRPSAAAPDSSFWVSGGGVACRSCSCASRPLLLSHRWNQSCPWRLRKLRHGRIRTSIIFPLGSPFEHLDTEARTAAFKMFSRIPTF